MNSTPLSLGKPVRLSIALVAVLYILSLPENHTEVQDSLHNIVTVSEGNLDILLISNHLLDNALYYAFWKVMQVFGYPGNVELAMIIVNLAASFAALIVLVVILNRLRLPPYLQILSLAAVAGAYAFWLHAVECEIYNLPLPLLLLSLHRLLVMRENPGRWKDVLLLALYTTGAVLLHQQHVLFAVVMLIGLWLVLRQEQHAIGWMGVFGRLGAYGLTSMVAVMLAYYIVVRYVFGITEFSEMVQWARGQQAEDKWGYWSLLGPLKAMIGFSRAFVGGHFVFALPGLSDLLKENLLRDYLLEEEVFMVRNFSPLASIVLVVLTATFGVAVLFVAFRIIKANMLGTLMRSQSPAGDIRLAVIVGLAYILIYGVFNMWWEPQNSELWTSLIPFVVLSFMLLAHPLLGVRGVQYSLGVMVGCLMMVNIFGSILPQQSREDDYWFQFNRWLIEHARPDDLIVSGAGFISDGYLLLYTGADGLGTWNKGDELEQKFDEKVGRKKPSRIFFSSTIASPPQSLARRFKIDTSKARAFFEKRRDRLTLVHSDNWQRVYLYTPASTAQE